MNIVDLIETADTPLQDWLDERVLDLPDPLLDFLLVGMYVCDRAGFHRPLQSRRG